MIIFDNIDIKQTQSNKKTFFLSFQQTTFTKLTETTTSTETKRKKKDVNVKDEYRKKKK